MSEHERFTFDTEGRNRVRRQWHGNLNQIPVSYAYDFELRLIVANDPADGFHGSPARIAAAREELAARA